MGLGWWVVGCKGDGAVVVGVGGTHLRAIALCDKMQT